MDCSPPRSSVHGILQARIGECVAISFSQGFPGSSDFYLDQQVETKALSSESSELESQMCHILAGWPGEIPL